MKRHEFSKLQESIKKAKIVSLISKRTNGAFTKEELESIIENIDVDIQYRLIILNNAKEMSKYMNWNMYSEALDDTRIIKEFEIPRIILGECTFGVSNRMHIFTKDLYNMKIDPEFDVTKKLVISNLISVYNNTGENVIDRKEVRLIFYVPSDIPYEISEEVDYILKNFNL